MRIGNWRGMFSILTIYVGLLIRINYFPEKPERSGKKVKSGRPK
jgi:hypothetical protein